MAGPPPSAKPASLLARHANLAFIVALCLGSGTTVWLMRGPEAFLQALGTAQSLFLTILPSLGAGVLLAGLLQSLLPRDLITRRLGENSGVPGLLLATLAGILTPGGPMASFPMVLVLAAAGADRGALVAYISAWSLLGFQRTLVWELPILGADFALLRIVACLPLPVLAGALARLVPFAITLPAPRR